MKTISGSDIAGMPVQQRIQLVEDIWDSIAAMPDAVEMPQWHKQELDKLNYRECVFLLMVSWA